MLTRKGTTKRVNKVFEHGIKFDSKLELYCYNAFKEAGIDFVFQLKYILQDKLRYNGEAIRQITLTVDFELPSYNMIVDTKGYQREDNKLKWKMLKQKLFNDGRTPRIDFPTSRKAVDALVEEIKAMKVK